SPRWASSRTRARTGRSRPATPSGGLRADWRAESSITSPLAACANIPPERLVTGGTMRVSAIMQTDLVTTAPDAAVVDVARLLTERRGGGGRVRAGRALTGRL